MTAMTTAPRLLSLARNPCRRLLLSHFMTPSLFTGRTFVSTQPRRAAPALAPATPAVLRRSPTVEDIHTAELDVEPLAQGDAQLALTECAAQVCCDLILGVNSFDTLYMYSNCIEYLPKKSIRVRPCESLSSRAAAMDINIKWSSHSSALSRTSTPRSIIVFLSPETEKRPSEFEHPVVNRARVIVDAVSLTLLRGSTIDFATELIGSSFRVVNNPQAVGSGCGCGVSWEAKT